MLQRLERKVRERAPLTKVLRAPAEDLPFEDDSFDVVVSTCLLTQLQLSLLQLIGERHQLFVVLREFLTLTHLRTLVALSGPGARVLLVTDLCDAKNFPTGRPKDDADLAALMRELLAAGHVIHAAHPQLIQSTLVDDPVLARAFGPAELSEPWLWQNGPEGRFLVYGMALARKA